MWKKMRIFGLFEKKKTCKKISQTRGKMRTTSPPCIVHPEMASCHLHSLWGLASAPYYFPFCSLLFLSFIFSFLLFPISFPAASVLCTVTEGVGAAGGNRPAAHPSPSGAPPPCTHWCRTRSVHSPRMRRIRGGGRTLPVPGCSVDTRNQITPASVSPSSL